MRYTSNVYRVCTRKWKIDAWARVREKFVTSCLLVDERETQCELNIVMKMMDFKRKDNNKKRNAIGIIGDVKEVKWSILNESFIEQLSIHEWKS